MEPDQIDILASAVLGDLQQIDDAQETRFSRQLPSDIRKPDRRDRIHLDFTFFHRIPATYPDMGTLPYSDTASDIPATDSFAKPLGERHEESLHRAADEWAA